MAAERNTRQRTEVTQQQQPGDDYVPQSRAYYDFDTSAMITRQALNGRASVNQGHTTAPQRRPLGKTQSLPANYFSASLANSANNTLELASQQVKMELAARESRELLPYAGAGPPPRLPSDASNPFSQAPLRQGVFDGEDMDWENEFSAGAGAAAADSSSPVQPEQGSSSGGAAAFAAPNVAASPTRRGLPTREKKRTHEEHAQGEEVAHAPSEGMDEVPEMNVDRAIRQPRRRGMLRATTSLPAGSFEHQMGP